jgi:diguanylate cyclase (GGDEF)-like protein
LLVFKRTIYPLILPTTILILATVLVWQWDKILLMINNGRQLQTLPLILPIIPYLILLAGFFMGWRYHNAGLMLASLTLGCSYVALTLFSADNPAQENMNMNVFEAVAFLLPMNLASFVVMTKRRIFTTVVVVSLVLVLIQCFIVLLVYYPQGQISSQLITQINHRLPWLGKNLSGCSLWVSSALSYDFLIRFENLAAASIIAFILALVFALSYFIYTRDIRIGGFFLALIAFLLGFAAEDPDPAIPFYFMAGGLALIITTVEASFSMAYLDELTGLAGRRSLNDTLIHLGKNYAIAMIDVDRFKKFNDTYGHKTGDQVLKMIASKLEQISGGARTFRYGGEEFTAIFSGKDAEESITYVEDFRRAIESTPFVVRGKDRRRGRRKKGGSGKSSDQKEVKVTVSIGIASPDEELTDPEKVLKAADKSLYKAKKGGRNRVAWK